MRAVSATTSASKGGPAAGISSEETRGAIQPMSSTGTGISSGSEARLAYPHLAWPPTSVIVMWPIVVSALAPCQRSEEHTSELQSQSKLGCRLLLEYKKKITF